MSKFADILIQEFYEVKVNMKFEFLKIYRRKKIRNILIISILIAELFYLIPLLSDSGFPEESITFISNLMGSIGLIFVLFASFLGADAINREHTKGTDLLIYPLPQRKSNVILAKYLSLLMTAWLGIIVYYGLILLNTWQIYGGDNVPDEMLTSFLVSMVYMTTILAFAFLVSSLINSTASSVTLTFFALLILIPLLDLLLGVADIDTGWIFTNYESLITGVLRLSTIGGGPFQTDISELDFAESIFHLIAQTIAFILLFFYFGTKKEVGSQ